MPSRFRGQRNQILRPISFVHLLVLASLLLAGATTHKPLLFRTASRNVSDMSNKNGSGVLGELKATIRKQKNEIENLQQQLKEQHKSKGVVAVGHGGHGGGEVGEQDISNYLQEPFYKTSFRRVGWLGIFLGSLSFTALIMNNFEHTLEKHIELSYFVPLLAGHGGNTGGQTIGTVLSALSAGSIQRKDATKVVVKETLSGILSGCILGFIVTPIVYKVMGISFHVTTVLFFTMPLLSTIAATLGAIIPFICIFFGLDPSVIAAPAMTSIVDVCGLLSYFLIANKIFKMYGLDF
jgi:cation transporter-like permease